MQPNFETGFFEFDSAEKAALRLPSDYDEWPLNRAVDLLKSCQDLSTNIINPLIYPNGEGRNYAYRNQSYYRNILLNIIKQLQTHDLLPSVAEGAEEFLKQSK